MPGRLDPALYFDYPALAPGGPAAAGVRAQPVTTSSRWWRCSAGSGARSPRTPDVRPEELAGLGRLWEPVDLERGLACYRAALRRGPARARRALGAAPPGVVGEARRPLGRRVRAVGGGPRATRFRPAPVGGAGQVPRASRPRPRRRPRRSWRTRSAWPAPPAPRSRVLDAFALSAASRTQSAASSVTPEPRLGARAARHAGRAARTSLPALRPSRRVCVAAEHGVRPPRCRCADATGRALYRDFADFQPVLCDSPRPSSSPAATRSPSPGTVAVPRCPPAWTGCWCAAWRSAPGPAPTTLSALLAVVDPDCRAAASACGHPRHATLARRHGLRDLIAPVRPTLKHRYPLTPMVDYVRWRRADRAPFDPWLRLALAAGRADPARRATLDGDRRPRREWEALDGAAVAGERPLRRARRARAGHDRSPARPRPLRRAERLDAPPGLSRLRDRGLSPPSGNTTTCRTLASGARGGRSANAGGRGLRGVRRGGPRAAEAVEGLRAPEVALHQDRVAGGVAARS